MPSLLLPFPASFPTLPFSSPFLSYLRYDLRTLRSKALSIRPPYIASSISPCTASQSMDVPALLPLLLLPVCGERAVYGKEPKEGQKLKQKGVLIQP